MEIQLNPQHKIEVELYGSGEKAICAPDAEEINSASPHAITFPRGSAGLAITFSRVFGAQVERVCISTIPSASKTPKVNPYHPPPYDAYPPTIGIQLR
jgi:hypothetical protein